MFLIAFAPVSRMDSAAPEAFSETEDFAAAAAPEARPRPRDAERDPALPERPDEPPEDPEARREDPVERAVVAPLRFVDLRAPAEDVPVDEPEERLERADAARPRVAEPDPPEPEEAERELPDFDDFEPAADPPLAREVLPPARPGDLERLADELEPDLLLAGALERPSPFEVACPARSLVAAIIYLPQGNYTRSPPNP